MRKNLFKLMRRPQLRERVRTIAPVLTHSNNTAAQHTSWTHTAWERTTVSWRRHGALYRTSHHQCTEIARASAMMIVNQRIITAHNQSRASWTATCIALHEAHVHTDMPHLLAACVILALSLLSRCWNSADHTEFCTTKGTNNMHARSKLCAFYPRTCMWMYLCAYLRILGYTWLR